MIGRSIAQDLPRLSRNQTGDYGMGAAAFGLAKTLPSRLAPLRHSYVPRPALANTENMNAIFIPRQVPIGAAQKQQRTLLNRLRSSYTLLPFAGSSR